MVYTGSERGAFILRTPPGTDTHLSISGSPLWINNTEVTISHSWVIIRLKRIFHTAFMPLSFWDCNYFLLSISLSDNHESPLQKHTQYYSMLLVTQRLCAVEICHIKFGEFKNRPWECRSDSEPFCTISEWSVTSFLYANLNLYCCKENL